MGSIAILFLIGILSDFAEPMQPGPTHIDVVDIQAKYIRGGLASPVRPRITPMLPNRPTYQSSDPMSDMPPLSTITAGNRALNVNGYRPFVDLKVSKGLTIYGDISIGTPVQLIRVTFSTNSPYIVVPSISCNILSMACLYHRKYDSSISTTYRPFNRPLSIYYDSFTASGHMSNDTVRVAGMRLDGQLFAEITQFSKYAIFQANDGVVGLDFRHKEMGQARTLLDVMYTRGLIREPSFAFQMTRKNGVIIFGRSVRDTYIAPLNYVHLSNNNHWQIRVDHIQVVGHPDEYCIQGCETLVDPSNNKIAGPYRSMKRLNTQVIGAQISRIDGRYYVPCALVSTLPDIVITINNVKYVLTPSVYIVPKRFKCVSVFTGLPSDIRAGIQLVLGSPFFLKRHIAFNKDSRTINIAAAVDRNYHELVAY